MKDHRRLFRNGASRPAISPALRGFALCCLLAARVAAQPPPSANGRVEETNPSVTWTGAWSTNSLPANSGGAARLTMDAGARAVFAFSGTSVTWFGYRDEWCGLADVFLDGILQATVDSYATPARPQAPLFSVRGLAEGKHTLSIEAKGTHGPGSSGSWVWVDAFLVPERPSSAPPVSDARRFGPATSSADPPTRSPRSGFGPRAPRGEGARLVDQEDPAASWTGSWSINRLPIHRGHSARLSMEAASRVEFAFTGTGVNWIGYRDEWSGVAEVFVDGRVRASIDTYSKTAQAQVSLYAIDGLRNGPHILAIQPTGRRGPAAGGAWIWVDGFSVIR